MKLGFSMEKFQFLRPILPMAMWKKLAVLAGVYVLIIGSYTSFFWTPLLDEIERQEKQVSMQKTLLAKNKMLAKDLPRKEKEFAKLEKQLKVALSFLPKKSQIPDLLESVSWAGKDSGLDFRVFKPLNENARQFWAEVPVDIDVTGTYKQLATFLKRVGEMPRIVDIQGLKLSYDAASNGLKVEGKAVTYRFIEEDEQKKRGKSGKGRKR
ncbi:MAG: type 4a pilus biogenesis protein PilO [Mariprofundaceae bacterium]